MSFGKRLRELRIAKELTQQQLADTIKLSKANVSKYEADLVEPNLDTLRLLSKFFNVSIDYLLGFSDEKESDSYWISLDEIDKIDFSSIPEGTKFATAVTVTATAEQLEIFEDKLKSLDVTYTKRQPPKRPPLSVDLQDLITAASDLSDEDLLKVREYVELLKLKHNS